VASAFELRIRPATREDRDWIVALVPRLHEFGPPPWRVAELMDAFVADEIAAAVDAPLEDSVVFVAEQARDAAPLGFVYVVTEVDYFTRERHGHVSDIVVAQAGEGTGVGRALLEAAEQWAGARGYRLLTLNVFVKNERAHAVYEHCGYVPEWTKMVKELGSGRTRTSGGERGEPP
jgi:GNAT superfamily N-acetyltransferase